MCKFTWKSRSLCPILTSDLVFPEIVWMKWETYTFNYLWEWYKKTVVGSFNLEKDSSLKLWIHLLTSIIKFAKFWMSFTFCPFTCFTIKQQRNITMTIFQRHLAKQNNNEMPHFTFLLNSFNLKWFQSELKLHFRLFLSHNTPSYACFSFSPVPSATASFSSLVLFWEVVGFSLISVDVIPQIIPRFI